MTVMSPTSACMLLARQARRRNLCARSGELAQQMAADEARTPGDQPHHRLVIVRLAREERGTDPGERHRRLQVRRVARVLYHLQPRAWDGSGHRASSLEA